MHVFGPVMFAILVVLFPIYGVIGWRRLLRRLAAGAEDARLAEYSGTMIVEWLLASAVLLSWKGDLGLGFIASRSFLITTTIVVGICALIVNQVYRMQKSGGEAKESLRRQLEPVEKFLPHSAGERSVFIALAITAGFCEEILYRGFLIGYLAPALTLWGAVAASSIVFGFAHAYQGPFGIVKTGAVGAVMAAIFVLSGSLWPAILLHVMVDIQAGLIAYETFGRPALRT